MDFLMQYFVSKLRRIGIDFDVKRFPDSYLLHLYDLSPNLDLALLDCGYTRTVNEHKEKDINGKYVTKFDFEFHKFCKPNPPEADRRYIEIVISQSDFGDKINVLDRVISKNTESNKSYMY